MAPGHHPLAGKQGEGPPLAPPNWKWRAGNRICDMYFYSPRGKQFRSRSELVSYLETLKDPPDANLFVWRVTEEVLKNGNMPPKVEHVGVKKPVRTKARAQSSARGAGRNKRRKTSAAKPVPEPPIIADKKNASEIALSPTRAEPFPPVAPGFGPETPLTGTVSHSSPTAVEHCQLNDNSRDRKTAKRVRISVSHSFESILAGRSSFKWLYDSETLEKFLEEGARLMKNKCSAETEEMRNVLLERELDVSNICKYPNAVIRVFVALLRNEEAPASMGKVELANLCVNWKCKKRHYWCELEVDRMNAARKLTKLDEVQRRGDLSTTAVSQVDGEGSDRMHIDNLSATEDNVSAHPSELPNQLGGITTRQHSRHTYGFARAATEQSVHSQLQESSISCTSRNLEKASGEKAGASGPSFEELPSGSTLNHGDPALSHAPGSDGRPEATGGVLHEQDPSVSKEALPSAVESPTANYLIGSGVLQGLKERTQRMSERSSDPSCDRARTSEGIDGQIPLVSQTIPEDPFLCPRGTAIHMVAHDDALAAVPASDLDGENIIVITGFKSSPSKGSGCTYRGDEAAQLNGVRVAVDGGRSTSASELPSTADNGCKPSAHSKSTASVIDPVPSSTQGQANPEVGVHSEGVNITAHSPATVRSEPNELTSRGDISNVGSKEPGTQREELLKTDKSALPVNDVDGIIEGGISKALSFLDGIKLPNGSNSQTTTGNGAEVALEDPAPQAQKDAVNQETRILDDEDDLPSVKDRRHFKDASEPLVDQRDGVTSPLKNGTFCKENVSLTALQTVVSRDSFGCWCKICGNDFSFCRGCMCSFCQKSLQPGEDWAVVKCFCSHICHMDCALAANSAGVVKELGLDGELSCPSCSQRVDLWPFFQKRFDLILSLSEAADLKGLEKHLLQVLQLLKGTQRTKYKSIEGLVLESYELIKKFPMMSLVRTILCAVCDELRAPHLDAESLDGGILSSATPEAIDWPKEEELARESLDHVKSERLLLEGVVDKVNKAYEHALNRRKEAGRAPRITTLGENQPLKRKLDSSAVPKERVIELQAKLNQEKNKLWGMSKFEFGEFTTISALDGLAEAWIENLRQQRMVVEAAQTELERLQSLNSHTTEDLSTEDLSKATVAA